MNATPCLRNACQGFYGDCLDVKFTNLCNGACAFCIEQGGYSPEPAPVNVLIGHAIADPSPTVLVLGGEPLADAARLLEFLKGIRPYKKKIYLTTNGTLLTESLANELRRYLDGVNVSVHHYDQQKNETVLKGGAEGARLRPYSLGPDFRQLERAIRKLGAFGVPTRLNVNLVKGFIDSYEEASEMLRFTESIGAAAVRFTELQNVGNDLFVDATKVFTQFAEIDPWTDGCEQEIAHDTLKVHVKIGCGHVVASRPEPPYDGKHSCHVMYPNGEITKGWVTRPVDREIGVWKGPDPTCQPKQPSEPDFGCHGMGCHY